VMVARALVPAGFMTEAVDGKVRLVMCSEVAKVTDPHTVNNDDADTHTTASSHTGICPFAFSAGAALGQSNVSGFDVQFLRDYYNPHSQLQLFTTHPTAVYRVRGPPTFS
jgi:hypothetical protein